MKKKNRNESSTYIVPPKIAVAVTGVRYIEINGETVTLFYTDGTKQAKDIQVGDRQDKEFLDLISLVQT